MTVSKSRFQSGAGCTFCHQAPLFTVAAKDTIIVEGRSSAIDEQRERMRGKVILKFHEKVDSLLVSGLLANGDELNNKPAVVDAPWGEVT